MSPGRTLAENAAREADTVTDLRPYDNDGDGYVDAFVVVHAGGDIPARPSAWRKTTQGWVAVVGEAAEGDQVVCRARLTAWGVVVAAHPPGQAFRATRG